MQNYKQYILSILISCRMVWWIDLAFFILEHRFSIYITTLRDEQCNWKSFHEIFATTSTCVEKKIYFVQYSRLKINNSCLETRAVHSVQNIGCTISNVQIYLIQKITPKEVFFIKLINIFFLVYDLLYLIKLFDVLLFLTFFWYFQLN